MALPETIIQAAPNQVFSEISNESVILNLSQGTYYGLNEVGTQIWHLIQTPTSVDAIVAQLLEEYDVSPEECRASVLALANSLQQQGLAEVKCEAVA
jgi:hypothetical protein